MAITITQAAEKFMQHIARTSDFRLTVTGGGCNGFVSELRPEAEPQAGDAMLVQNGLKVFLSAQTCRLLEGATIDSHENNSLVFINPNAGNCGCGKRGAGRGGRHVVRINIVIIIK